MSRANEPDPYLGEAIKRARERLQWTQQQLAERVAVDRKTVDNWENGRSSPRNRIGAIQDVLGVSDITRRAREIRHERETETVGAPVQDRAVRRRRDDSALADAVRELRRGLEQQARGTEMAQRAAAAIASELEADEE